MPHELANHDCRLSRPSYAIYWVSLLLILVIVCLTGFCIVVEQRDKLQNRKNEFIASIEEKQNELVGMQNRLDAVIRQRYKADVARLTAQNKCRELSREHQEAIGRAREREGALQRAVYELEDQRQVLADALENRARLTIREREELADCRACLAKCELGEPSPILPKADDPPPKPTGLQDGGSDTGLPVTEPPRTEPPPAIKPLPVPRVTIPTVAGCKCGCGKPNCHCRRCHHGSRK